MNKFFKLFLALVIVFTMLMSISVFAVDNENARYVMDSEVMFTGHIGVLFVKGGTSSSGVVTGGSLYFGKYDPILDYWDEYPVGETAPIAKEAAFAFDDIARAHVAYIDENDNLVYIVGTVDTWTWSDPVVITSNNFNNHTGKLSAPDIAVDKNRKAHISYIDSDGAEDDYYARSDGMYATNASGSFVKTVIANCTGWFSSPDGDRNELVKPIKIGVNESGDYWIAFRETYWSKWMGGSDTSYSFEFRSKNNSSIGTNNSGTIYEVCSDGETFYVLLGQSGQYWLVDKTNGVANSAYAMSLFAADMTIDDSALYYAAINGTSLLFYQDGTFVDDLTATTGILSAHNKISTVVTGGKQFIIYTGSDEDRSLIISSVEDSVLNEYMVPNTTYWTVSYDLNNGDIGATNSIEDGTEITLPSAEGLTVPEGTAFAGWLIGESIHNAGTTYTVYEDTTIQALWYEIVETANCTFTIPSAGANPDFDIVSSDSDKYTVSLVDLYLYEEPYTSLVSGDEYEMGKVYAYRIRFYSNPGYIFVNGETEFTMNGEPTWSYGRIDERENSYSIPMLYNITLDPNNGTDETDGYSNVEEGTVLTLSSPSNCGFTEPEGKVFAGWLDDEILYKAGAQYTVTADATLVAQWDTLISTVTIPPAVMPEIGDTPNYNFEISGDLGYTISTVEWLDVNNEYALLTDEDILVNGGVYRLDVLFTPDEGYIFDSVPNIVASIEGVDESEYTSTIFSGGVGGKGRLACFLFNPLVEMHTVTFDLAGGSGELVEVQYVADGDTAVRPEGIFTHDNGWAFQNWYLNPSEATIYDDYFKFDSTPITEDITLEALWSGYAVVRTEDESMGKIAIDYSGDELDYYETENMSLSITKKYNNKVSIGAVPNEGYRFVKWTLKGEDYSTEPELSLAAEGGNMEFTAVFAQSAGGDLDGDNQITIIDVRLLLQIYINSSSSTTWSEQQLALMDMDGNGSIDILDVRILLQKYINS